MDNYFGQRNIPEIIIISKGNKYNITECYKDYTAIHDSDGKSKWIIKVALLPEGLRENLNKGYFIVYINEMHRMINSGKDVLKSYIIDEVNVQIIEEHDSISYDCMQYQIIITGFLRVEGE